MFSIDLYQAHLDTYTQLKQIVDESLESDREFEGVIDDLDHPKNFEIDVPRSIEDDVDVRDLKVCLDAHAKTKAVKDVTEILDVHMSKVSDVANHAKKRWLNEVLAFLIGEPSPDLDEITKTEIFREIDGLDCWSDLFRSAINHPGCTGALLTTIIDGVFDFSRRCRWPIEIKSIIEDHLINMPAKLADDVLTAVEKNLVEKNKSIDFSLTKILSPIASELVWVWAARGKTHQKDLYRVLERHGADPDFSKINLRMVVSAANDVVYEKNKEMRNMIGPQPSLNTAEIFFEHLLKSFERAKKLSPQKFDAAFGFAQSQDFPEPIKEEWEKLRKGRHANLFDGPLKIFTKMKSTAVNHPVDYNFFAHWFELMDRCARIDKGHEESRFQERGLKFFNDASISGLVTENTVSASSKKKM